MGNRMYVKLYNDRRSSVRRSLCRYSTANCHPEPQVERIGHAECAVATKESRGEAIRMTCMCRRNGHVDEEVRENGRP